MKLPRQSSLPAKKTDDAGALKSLAIEILGYLAGEPNRMMRFFDLTGLTPPTLRYAATQPGFEASLLDYLAADDRLLLAFAHDTGHDPARIEGIYQRLKPSFCGDV